MGFPAMEPLVQHPVEKEPSRKLSDRRSSCRRPSTRIASWELSMTAPWGALDSLRENDRQSGTTKREARTLKFSTLHRLPSPPEPREKSCGRLTKSTEVAGTAFPQSTGPVQPCRSFFSAAEGRSRGLRDIHHRYNIYSIPPPSVTRTSTGNDVHRGPDR